MPGESGGGLQAEKVDQCGPREGTVSFCGRHGAFTIMHMYTCSGLTPKDDFVRYMARNSSLQGLEERRQEHEFFAPSVKRRFMRLSSFVRGCHAAR